MFGKISRSISLLALALLLSSCETYWQCRDKVCPSDEEILARAGAVRLTPDQVKSRVLGNTEEWKHGGAYYPDDERIQVKWKKVRFKGTWELSDDGTICYQLPRWQRRCHFYMAKDEQIFLLDEGRNIGDLPTYRGNQLSRIGRYVNTLERRK